MSILYAFTYNFSFHPSKKRILMKQLAGFMKEKRKGQYPSHSH